MSAAAMEGLDVVLPPHWCTIPTDFARDDDGIFRCLICREMWCECCTQNGTYCRHTCPSHPKPSEPVEAWWGKPWVSAA